MISVVVYKLSSKISLIWYYILYYVRLCIISIDRTTLFNGVLSRRILLVNNRMYEGDPVLGVHRTDLGRSSPRGYPNINPTVDRDVVDFRPDPVPQVKVPSASVAAVRPQPTILLRVEKTPGEVSDVRKRLYLRFIEPFLQMRAESRNKTVGEPWN